MTTFSERPRSLWCFFVCFFNRPGGLVTSKHSCLHATLRSQYTSLLERSWIAKPNDSDFLATSVADRARRVRVSSFTSVVIRSSIVVRSHCVSRDCAAGFNWQGKCAGKQLVRAAKRRRGQVSYLKYKCIFRIYYISQVYNWLLDMNRKPTLLWRSCRGEKRVVRWQVEVCALFVLHVFE